MSKYRIKSFYPNFFSNKLIAYVGLSLAESMKSDIFDTSVMGIASIKNARAPFYKDAIPPLLKGIAYRLFSNEQLVGFAEYRFIKSIVKGDIVYLWPGSSDSLFKALKSKECIIIRENINTHTGFAKNILDEEYACLGFNKYNNISKGMISTEIEIQKCTDFVFSPSPAVTKSLLEYGVSSDSILSTSYGLKQSEILNNITRNYKDDDYEIGRAHV